MPWAGTGLPYLRPSRQLIYVSVPAGESLDLKSASQTLRPGLVLHETHAVREIADGDGFGAQRVEETATVLPVGAGEA